MNVHLVKFQLTTAETQVPSQKADYSSISSHLSNCISFFFPETKVPSIQGTHQGDESEVPRQYFKIFFLFTYPFYFNSSSLSSSNCGSRCCTIIIQLSKSFMFWILETIQFYFRLLCTQRSNTTSRKLINCYSNLIILLLIKVKFNGFHETEWIILTYWDRVNHYMW